MDKRYQVFVSSTYTDLLKARQEVMQALLELDCIPAGMELFPAADDDQWTLIKQVIDDCDYYIVIIGGRYGSIGHGGKSFTQMEYEYAISEKKPVIAFLHKDPGKLPAEDTEKEPDKVQKLEEFRALTQQKMIRYWTSPADLGSAVSRSLIKLTKSSPAIGWVKSDLLPSKETTEEILQLRKQIDLLQSELEATKTTAPKETEHLSQGEDEYEINYSYGAFVPNRFRPNFVGSGTFDVSWNEIFARVSPLMIDEAPDLDLKKELGQLAKELNTEQLRQQYEELQQYELRDFTVDADDFNTIKVQLLALRLITKSVKSRSVKDTQNYWTLTPYGELMMMQLRAIRREDHEQLAPSTSNEEIESDVP